MKEEEIGGREGSSLASQPYFSLFPNIKKNVAGSRD